MPQPEEPAARSGANQGAAYSESAFNGASMPTPARSLYPKLAFFISLLVALGLPIWFNDWEVLADAKMRGPVGSVVCRAAH